jgi:urease accessory protein
VHGVARIGFAAGDKHTRLATLYQQAPLRVLFPRAPAGDPPHAVLVTTSGGLVGADLGMMERDARRAAALVLTNIKKRQGLDGVADFIVRMGGLPA